MKTTRWMSVAAAVVMSGCGSNALVTSVVPSVARSGEEIVLHGTGFGTGSSWVDFDDAQATVTEWSPEVIKVMVPRQTHPEVLIRVKARDGAQATFPFTIYDAFEAADGSPGAARTFVSISFDDTTADQLIARAAMAATGIKATFFVNSARTGSVAADQPAYLTIEDLRSLEAEGHEIAGHTRHHLDLTLVDEAEAVRQVCGDRDALLRLGLNVHTFAYPFGRQGPALERIVEGCGYSAARTMNPNVGPWPMVVPVANRFALPAANPATAATTLAELQTVVTQAEKVGGQWVPVNFHKLCDNGCSSSAVTPAFFEAFATWLAQRAPSGTVTRTFRQMVGNGVPASLIAQPAVPRTSENLIANPSLEAYTHGSNNPDCWLLADTGHELSHWSRVSPGHEGEFAQRLSAGDPAVSNRRIKMMQDDGSCAPRVAVGEVYEFSVWYQSDVPIRFNSFVRNERGFWASWGLGPIIPASPGLWARATWTLPPVPSFGLALAVSVRLQSADGTMTVDDFTLRKVGP